MNSGAVATPEHPATPANSPNSQVWDPTSETGQVFKINVVDLRWMLGSYTYHFLQIKYVVLSKLDASLNFITHRSFHYNYLLLLEKMCA